MQLGPQKHAGGGIIDILHVGSTVGDDNSSDFIGVWYYKLSTGWYFDILVMGLVDSPKDSK